MIKGMKRENIFKYVFIGVIVLVSICFLFQNFTGYDVSSPVSLDLSIGDSINLSCGGYILQLTSAYNDPEELGDQLQFTDVNGDVFSVSMGGDTGTLKYGGRSYPIIWNGVGNQIIVTITGSTDCPISSFDGTDSISTALCNSLGQICDSTKASSGNFNLRLACINNICTTSFCTDNEYGINFNVLGNVSGYWYGSTGVSPVWYSSVLSDICYNNTQLLEKYCNGDQLVEQVVSCPNSCVNGACVYSTLGKFCNSSFSCVSGLTCTNNLCQTPPACKSSGIICSLNSDCCSGLSCTSNHICLSPSPSCSINSSNSLCTIKILDYIKISNTLFQLTNLNTSSFTPKGTFKDITTGDSSEFAISSTGTGSFSVGGVTYAINISGNSLTIKTYFPIPSCSINSSNSICTIKILDYIQIQNHLLQLMAIGNLTSTNPKGTFKDITKGYSFDFPISSLGTATFYIEGHAYFIKSSENVQSITISSENIFNSSFVTSQITTSDNSQITFSITPEATNFHSPTLSVNQAIAYNTVLNTTQVSNVTLNVDESGQLFYVLSGIKQGRLFWIFPVSANVEQKIDANSGDVISTQKPWWSFFVGI